MLATEKVKDFMTATKVTFTMEMDVLQAINKMLELRISGAPVIDQRGNLIGFLSEKDCMKVALATAYQQDVAGGNVEQFMTKNVDTIDVDTPILEVAEKFLTGSYKRFPVVKDNRLVGSISRQDILRGLQTILKPDNSQLQDKQSTKQSVRLD